MAMIAPGLTAIPIASAHFSASCACPRGNIGVSFRPHACFCSDFTADIIKAGEDQPGRLTIKSVGLDSFGAEMLERESRSNAGS
jgi:hypothetical protein